MLTIELNMYHAVALGAFLFWMGGIITDKVRLLNRYCIPAPLIGGLCFSVLNCILYSAGIASVTFDSTLQTVFMIMFFTTVGFTVSIPALLKGGKAVVLCLIVSVVMIPLQNFLGGGVMEVFGRDSLLGIGCGFAGGILRALNTKPELMDGAVLYLRIYCLGMPALAVYNFGNAVFSAVGDTRRPLYYLSIAGVINVVLNLFFVIVCKMAADGVALASIISQYLSAVLVLLHMTHLTDSCRVEWKLLRLHGGEAGRILGLGIPAGIQHMIFAVANLFIQVGINSFDSTVVSGNSAAVNVDNVIYNVMAAFYTACSTFMGQNWGAGNKDRMMKSYYISLGYSFLIAAVLGVGFLLCGEPFLYIFTNDADVVAAGMERMQIMCFSYCISAFMDCTIAACRGIGRSFVPTIIVILGSCVFRVVWVYTLFAHFHTIPSLYLLYPFSWILTAAAEILYFIRCCRRLRIAQA